MASLHVRRIPILDRILTAFFGYANMSEDNNCKGWALAHRCSHCDFGIYADWSKKADMCVICGTPLERHIWWVGRTVAYRAFHINDEDSYHAWEWVPEERLPDRLQKSKPKLSQNLEALVQSEVEARIDAEFEARVQAAVEVALLERR